MNYGSWRGLARAENKAKSRAPIERGTPTSVAFSPDGCRLGAASPLDRAVGLWDPRSGRLRLQVAGHAGGTAAVAFSPAGRRLATSANYGMACLWNPTTGEPIAALDGHSSCRPKTAFSANGWILAATGSDDHIRVWNMDDTGGGDRVDAKVAAMATGIDLAVLTTDPADGDLLRQAAPAALRQVSSRVDARPHKELVVELLRRRGHRVLVRGRWNRQA